MQTFAGRDLFQYYGLMDRLKAVGRQIFERNGSRLGDFFNSLVTFVDRRDKEAATYNCVPWGINYLIRKSECARDTFYRYFNVLIGLGIIKTERGPGFRDRVVVYLPFVDRNLNVDASIFDNLTEERISEFIARGNGEVVQPELAVDNSSPVVQLTDVQTMDTKSFNDLNNIITIRNLRQDFLDELRGYVAGTAVNTWESLIKHSVELEDTITSGGTVDNNAPFELVEVRIDNSSEAASQQNADNENIFLGQQTTDGTRNTSNCFGTIIGVCSRNGKNRTLTIL